MEGSVQLSTRKMGNEEKKEYLDGIQGKKGKQKKDSNSRKTENENKWRAIAEKG